jgi:hypothetical protein
LHVSVKWLHKLVNEVLVLVCKGAMSVLERFGLFLGHETMNNNMESFLSNGYVFLVFINTET